MLRTAMEMRGFLCIRQMKDRDSQPFNCRAPYCLAWRAAKDIRPKKVYCENRDASQEPCRPANVPAGWQWVPRIKADLGVPAHWLQPESEAINHTLGYCGLAGFAEFSMGEPLC